MPIIRTRRGTAGRAASDREHATQPAGYSPRAAAIIALQRSAGNAATAGLMRRAHDVREQAPVTLTIPEVVDRAEVDTYSLEYDAKRRLVGLNITRPTDADSPRLAKALIDGPPSVTATFRVRSPHVLTITMDNCMISSFAPQGEYESVGLTFSQAHLDYPGESQ
jgi:Type VI secretion system effector, Hcp